MRNAFFRLLLLACLFFPAAAFAQSSATVVTTCGTLGQNYTAGAVRPLTQNTTGVLCSTTAIAGTVTVSGSVNLAAATTGGCTPRPVIASTASTNATNIKASVGTLCDWAATNTTTTLYYVHFYNTAGSPTCNASILQTYAIPPAGSAGQVGGFSRPLPYGHAYDTGIGVCITANADGTGNAATGVLLNIGYK